MLDWPVWLAHLQGGQEAQPHQFDGFPKGGCGSGDISKLLFSVKSLVFETFLRFASPHGSS